MKETFNLNHLVEVRNLVTDYLYLPDLVVEFRESHASSLSAIIES
jgi:hypothetical protein